MAAAPAGGVRLLHPRPWLRNLGRRARPLSILAASSPIQHSEELTTTSAPPKPPNKDKNSPSYYPKRGQTLELVCESLAFKGKGLCKVADTGFVVMCDRALPGEKFIGRVTRKKDNYAEVKKLKTITPHWDNVEAPCEFASHCGDKESEYDGIMKPIVPCDIQFHYRNKMEFSFGTKKWVPAELLGQECDETNGYALGLHAPGFYDKVLNIDNCLLQSDPANKVLAAIQDSWRDPELSLSPYDVHSHRGFLKHLMLRTGSACIMNFPYIAILELRACHCHLHLVTWLFLVLSKKMSIQVSGRNNLIVNLIDRKWELSVLRTKEVLFRLLSMFYCYIIVRNIETGQPELMVNFVTSSYQPELLKPLVEKIATFPDVVSVMNNVNTSVGNTSVGEEEYTLFGTIGLTLAKRVRHVYGFEIVDQAVSDARRNANLNGISNATFVQGDLNKIGENFGEYFPKPDLVITDPNRPGMHIKLIKFLLKLKAARIIYVSCNPATCARDLDYLCHGLHSTSGHVSAHSSHRMCLPVGAVLTSPTLDFYPLLSQLNRTALWRFLTCSHITNMVAAGKVPDIQN
ncbi:UNVERIFIED_CONTAM: putative RNA methyltransferase [Sesamum radiatum]|uniref:RNA methyltransferase n=1 Tax=Sesamum radiatum TaxID=300843 RepID=A0AAW2WJ67_SESRA